MIANKWGAAYSICRKTEIPGETFWRIQTQDTAILARLGNNKRFRRVVWTYGGDGLEVYQFQAPDRKQAKALVENALNDIQD